MNNPVPNTGMKIQDQIEVFVAAAGNLTAFGIMGLAITAIMLLLTIEGSFNRIFRVAQARPLLLRISVLSTVLTVGPFLIAISLSLFGYFSVFLSAGVLTEFFIVLFGQVAPTLVSWIAIMAGAVLTAALPDWRLVRSGVAGGPGLKLAVALEILAHLAMAFRHGGAVNPQRLALAMEVPEVSVLDALGELSDTRYAVAIEGGTWKLGRDLTVTPPIDLVHQFGFGVGPAARELEHSPLGRRVSKHLKQAVESEQKLLNIKLDQVVEDEAPRRA